MKTVLENSGDDANVVMDGWLEGREASFVDVNERSKVLLVHIMPQCLANCVVRDHGAETFKAFSNSGAIPQIDSPRRRGWPFSLSATAISRRDTACPTSDWGPTSSA